MRGQVVSHRSIPPIPHRSLWQSRCTQAGDGIFQRPLRPVPIVGPRAVLSYRQTGPQLLQFSDGPYRIIPSTEAAQRCRHTYKRPDKIDRLSACRVPRSSKSCRIVSEVIEGHTARRE